MNALIIIFLAILGAALAVTAAVYLVVPFFKGLAYIFRGIGWLVAHVFRFVFGMIGDVLRAIGAIITSLVFVPLVLINVLIGRWSASAHFGRALQQELTSIAHCTYRVLIGHPARFLLLDSLTEGIEKRVPDVMAKAPGSDKPSKRTGTFPGYKIVGSLRGGGSGGKLYVAEPLPEKRSAFAREGVPDLDEVVIKSFSIQDGSSLPQIIRESRALEAARKLQLVLDHELTEERFFYVMPYVPGEDLSDRTQALHAASGTDGLSPALMREGAGYVVDLLHTLDRYHAGGLWHKDIKPDNIIVHDGRAHLVDLGLVTPLRSAMTLTTHGTEYFRDPELVRLALRGVKVHEVDGVKFDIYGAGAVLYSVIENSFPAHGGLSQITKRCPDALKWVIRRAMTDLNQRYPSVRHMLADLTTIVQAEDPYAIKPAELPSMVGADLADISVETSPEPGAKAPAGAVDSVGAAAAAAIPVSHSPEPAFVSPPARSPVPPPRRNAPPGPPRITVLDWWTGRYAVEHVPEAAMPGQMARTPRPPRNPVRPIGGRPAREQLASARARVQSARSRARERMVGRSAHARRNPHYSNAPNFGVGIAVVVMVGAVFLAALLLGGPRHRPSGTMARSTPYFGLYQDDPDGNGRTIRMIVDDGEHTRRVLLGPRDDWAGGDKELAVAVAPVGADHEDLSKGGFDADDISEDIFAGGKHNPRLLFIDFTPPEDVNSPLADHFSWLQVALADVNAEVLGFGDDEQEIELIAGAQHTIGTSLPNDPQTTAALRDWMNKRDPIVDGVFWIMPDEDWHFITAQPGHIERLYDELNLDLTEPADGRVVTQES